MKPRKSYPAKLLLFGEYTVLHGGSALAIPYTKYAGHWIFLPQGESAKYSLLPFYEYLSTTQFPNGVNIDLSAFAKDIANGLAFDSTIPIGYGAGSSGSLCAGIWDRYGGQIDKIPLLREIFAQMESFFHGKSSGLDPLVSYLNRPILQSSDGLEVLDSIEFPQNITILDSKLPRSTEPFVQWYNQAITENTIFKQQVVNHLLPLNTQAILAIITKDDVSLKEAFRAISIWQFKYFRPLIPDTVYAIWASNLKKGHYLKICGAGGGGFFLQLSH